MEEIFVNYVTYTRLICSISARMELAQREEQEASSETPMWVQVPKVLAPFTTYHCLAINK